MVEDEVVHDAAIEEERRRALAAEQELVNVLGRASAIVAALEDKVIHDVLALDVGRRRATTVEQRKRS